MSRLATYSWSFVASVKLNSKKAYTIEKNPLEYDIKPVRQSIQGTKRSSMSKLDETCIQYWVYLPNIRNFGIWATFNSLSIKMQFQEAFYHATALVHRPSGTNEIIDIIDKSSKNMDPKSIFRFIPHYFAFRFNQQKCQRQLFILWYCASHMIIPTLNHGLVKWSQTLLPD